LRIYIKKNLNFEPLTTDRTDFRGFIYKNLIDNIQSLIEKNEMPNQVRHDKIRE